MNRSIPAVALCCLGAALIGPVLAQDAAQKPAQTAAVKSSPAPKPAQDLVAAARGIANKEHKATLVMFHASWCGWCKRLDAVMSRPEFKKMFAANYQLVTLDVLENGAKVAELENPGGKELMKEFGGEKSGLPFYAWLDADGKKIADSNVMPKDQNIGYPGEPAEIEAFMALIKKTAPNWPEADQKTLHDYLVANAPKH
jgi:thiol:disulfide interchange protein